MSIPALWTKHRPIAYGIAREYRLPGADQDDLDQEALVALWQAATAYDKAKGPFPPFARLVIHRRLKDAVRAANRVKHRLLSDSARDTVELVPALEQSDAPEQLRLIVDAASKLSPLEREALAAFLNGRPYSHSKPLDNALQRARRKLRAA